MFYAYVLSHNQKYSCNSSKLFRAMYNASSFWEARARSEYPMCDSLTWDKSFSIFRRYLTGTFNQTSPFRRNVGKSARLNARWSRRKWKGKRCRSGALSNFGIHVEKWAMCARETTHASRLFVRQTDAEGQRDEGWMYANGERRLRAR